MSNSIRHVGIVVHNLEKSIQFWEEIIGVKKIIDQIEKSPYIDELLGIQAKNLRTVKFIDENNFIIELLHYPNKSNQEKWMGSLDSVGLTHIAITTKDIDELVSRLNQNGYKSISNILKSPDNKVRVVFVYGPESLFLEVVEQLD